MSFCHGDTAKALDNRRIFLGGVGIDYRRLVCCQQVHSDNIRYIEDKDCGRGALSKEDSLPQTDGMLTDEPDVALAVFTADCPSLFLYDPRRPAIGLVHAGWRGTKLGIAAKAVAMMCDRFESRPLNLRAGFGPAIRKCCYEVSGEFSGFFDYGLSRNGNRYYLDLIGVNREQLLEAGLRQENISDCGICTSCSKREFFSFRIEGDSCGRMMSVAMLRPAVRC